MKGFVKFEKILSYEFVVDSLKRLKRMEIGNYVLFDNSSNMISEAELAALAKEKLEAEKVHDMLIRPKLPV